MQDRFDKISELATRELARRTSRRGLLGFLGGLLVGQAALPLLPVARAQAQMQAADMDNNYPGVASRGTGDPKDPGDITSCDYWRYCGVDGFLCACCGGSHNSCPPGTQMVPLTWIGTCQNPTDGVNYIISYNDCCGLETCGRCLCNRNEGDLPLVRPQANNDINWCVGGESKVYNCTTAVVLGIALDNAE